MLDTGRVPLFASLRLQPVCLPGLLACLLESSEAPATITLGKFAGVALHYKIAATGERDLGRGEACELGIAEGIPCKWRTGRLVTPDGITAAGTWLLWLPSLLDEDANAALDAGDEPAGVILGRLGMRREQRRAAAVNVICEITGEDASVTSRAVLVVNGQAVGIAEEFILWEWTDLLT